MGPGTPLLGGSLRLLGATPVALREPGGAGADFPPPGVCWCPHFFRTRHWCFLPQGQKTRAPRRYLAEGNSSFPPAFLLLF